MSDPINIAGPAAAQNAPPDTAKTERRETPENIHGDAAEFASLMEGKANSKVKSPKPQHRGDAETPAGSDLSEDAGHFAEAFGQKRLPKSQAQNEFADSRSAALAKEHTGDLTSEGAEPVVQEKSQQSFGDSILQTLGATSSGAETTAANQTSPGVSEVRVTAPSDTIAEVSQTIADRILVSDPAHGGDAEVRITMKDSVLPGTEVRITEKNGELQIQFHTDSPESRDMLSKHQMQMTERLNERLERNVAVDIEFDSKGQGDQQGRSRQQRDLIDELNNRDEQD